MKEIKIKQLSERDFSDRIDHCIEMAKLTSRVHPMFILPPYVREKLIDKLMNQQERNEFIDKNTVSTIQSNTISCFIVGFNEGISVSSEIMQSLNYKKFQKDNV